jgi:hypothetical protein
VGGAYVPEEPSECAKSTCFFRAPSSCALFITALTPMTAAPRSGTSSRTTRSGGRWNIRSRWTRTATWRRSRTSYATSLPMHVPTCLPCRERGVRGLTREVETPLPSHPPVRPGAASVTTARGFKVLWLNLSRGCGVRTQHKGCRPGVGNLRHQDLSTLPTTANFDLNWSAMIVNN